MSDDVHDECGYCYPGSFCGPGGYCPVCPAEPGGLVAVSEGTEPTDIEWLRGEWFAEPDRAHRIADTLEGWERVVEAARAWTRVPGDDLTDEERELREVVRALDEPTETRACEGCGCIVGDGHECWDEQPASDAALREQLKAAREELSSHTQYAAVRELEQRLAAAESGGPMSEEGKP